MWIKDFCFFFSLSLAASPVVATAPGEPSATMVPSNSKQSESSTSTSSISNQTVASLDQQPGPSPAAGNESSSSDHIKGGKKKAAVQQTSQQQEIKVALNEGHEGQSFKFSIPGTSQSVTLNFR